MDWVKVGQFNPRFSGSRTWCQKDASPTSLVIEHLLFSHTDVNVYFMIPSMCTQLQVKPLLWLFPLLFTTVIFSACVWSGDKDVL